MTKNRLYGLDLLRIISMLLITIIHYIGYSDILSNTNLSFANEILFNGLSALTTIAVNVFVLITGYFSCEKKVNFKRIFLLWAQVVVISVILTIIGFLCLNKPFSITTVIKSFLPILTGHFWFFAIYVILTIMSPFINVFIDGLSKKWHLAFCVVLFAIISVYFVSNPFIGHINYIATPRGICWFVYLYIVGAYIKKYVGSVSKLKLGLFSVILLSSIFALKYTGINSYLNIELLEYYSILPFVFSVVVFVLFKEVEIRTAFAKKIVGELSSCSFFVYVLQEHDSIRYWYWGVFSINEYASTPWQIVVLLVSVLVLWPVAFITSKFLLLLTPIFNWIYANMQKLFLRVVSKLKNKLS